MTRVLKISPDLSLPLNFVTSTMVIYGGKGMGKTNLGSVLMEELAASHLRFAVIDPMGVWWGLRHDKSGKGEGIEVLILGGTHGDIPIEPTGGAVVADLVVDETVNVVIDISRRPDGTMWSIGERVRFVTDYCKRLYQRQGERRRPLMQVIDEAARFSPQQIRSGDIEVAKCMGAVAVLVEEGRNVGIGVCLITQRSARLNKDVAELADCMIAFRTVGPNSRRAVLDWLGEHVEKERLKELDAAVRSVAVGSALVVSPGWLEVETVVRFRARQTFDSSKTPKAGETEAHVSGEGAKPDLNKYVRRMAETIERVKADDPKELRRRIAELERSVKAKAPPAAAPTKAGTVDVRPFERRIKQLVGALEQAMKFIVEVNTQDFFKAAGESVDKEKIEQAITAAVGQATKMIEQDLDRRRASFERWQREGARILKSMGTLVEQEEIKVTVNVRHNEEFTMSAPRRPSPDLAGGDGGIAEGLTKPQQRILDALAWLEAVGVDRGAKSQVGFLAEASPTSSAFGNNLGTLRTAGLIRYPSGGEVQLTAEGRSKANTPERPGTAEDLHAMIFARLPQPQVRILEVLIRRYPDRIGKDDLAGHASASPTSSAYGNNLGTLRSLGFIDYPEKGQVVAEPVLFLEGNGR